MKQLDIEAINSNSFVLLFEDGKNKIYFKAVSPLLTNCYVVVYDGFSFCVDPGDEAFLIKSFLSEYSIDLDFIIATHSHIDHVGGVYELKSYFNSKFFLDERDFPLYDSLKLQAMFLGLEEPKKAKVDISDIDSLKSFLPEGIEIFHTPGHSPGSVSIFLERYGILFSGDLLFKESIGRTDLWGGSMEEITRSILTLYNILDDDVVVFPGHGESTTIGHEKIFNMFVKVID